ncbi:glycosyltransferase family 4 protein [Ruficoccus amylovorans]|uniref:Glycosyltransferase family 4 protein n=1 Tax=Ruficoccus amylovorans TaxID=1804625 RepID=A0A842HC97_9BACT|nr:glycosyltransferase family 4 protein [Ruficoccus amylovorans]MBC2594042.1 glycosyltransferase family 4 protein [Ruficoccus amylovorans]
MQINRLAVSEVSGDNQTGRFHGLIRELARHIPHIEHIVGGKGMSGWQARLINGLPHRRDSTQEWWRRQRSIFAYRAKSRYVEDKILAMNPRPDLCLQMLQHFCPFMTSRRLPYVIYLDYTMAQAAENFPGWTRGRNRLQLACHIHDEGVALRNALHLFSFTENTRRYIMRRFGVPGERITAVGVGGPHVNSEPRAHLDPLKLLYVGHEFERKGGRTLYEAFTRLRTKHPGLSLTVVGDDAEAPPEGVICLGKVSDPAQMNRLYREAGAFVLPSLCDPSPLVIVEAMHHGLPVVSTRVDGIPEMVLDGKTGLLVPPRDSAALADALDALIRRPEAERLAMSRAGRAHAQTHFNWQRTGEKTWEVLQRL